MGCINVKIIHNYKPITATAARIGDSITTLINKVENEIHVDIERIGEQLKAIVDNMTKPIMASVSVVCSLSDFYYMNVSPNEVQWITDDTGVFFDVESNVQWIIVTN